MSDFLEMAVLVQKQLIQKEKNKLSQLQSQAKGNSLQQEIMKKAIDLRASQPGQGQSQGQAMIGNQPISVQQGAEQLPFLDQAARQRV